MRKIILTMMLLSLVIPVRMVAENKEDSISLIKQRQRSIDVHKIGYGLEYGFGNDYSVSPKVYYEYGSNYGLLNYSAGLKLTLITPIFHVDNDKLSAVAIPIFMAMNANVIRWKHNCFYVGVECDYSFHLSSSYYSHDSGSTLNDKNIAQSFMTVYGNIGIKLPHWNVSFRYGYDLKPRFNQKYIYESADYDYEAVKSTLFRRNYFIISLAYYLPL